MPTTLAERFVPVDRPVERIGRCVFGLLLFGVGITLLIDAELGAAPWDVFHTGVTELTAEGCERALEHIERAVEPLAGACSTRPDAELLTSEWGHVAGLLRFAARFGRERCRGELAGQRGKDLMDELEDLIAAHRRLWLARSRPGGLDEATAWLASPGRLLAPER